ncbi:MAG: hypothetical protein ACR2RA_13840, partial [Geminicoccaceae bacterium]
MVLRGVSAISESEADELIAKGLKSYNLSELNPDRIRQALVERSGMLQESSGQTIEFLHNTLKEYLASERFANQGDVDTLATNCFEESWQPVILFAIALPREGSSFSAHVVREVLARTSLEEPTKERTKSAKERAATIRSHQFFFFRCCATAYQIDDKEALDAFRQLADQLIPPRNLTDAEAIAACGETVVPYLKRNSGFSAQQQAACVRALGIIGGQLAQRAISEYSSDTRQTVLKELARTLKIPLELPGIQKLVSRQLGMLPWWLRQQLSNLSGITSLANLRKLVFGHCLQLSNISG